MRLDQLGHMTPLRFDPEPFLRADLRGEELRSLMNIDEKSLKAVQVVYLQKDQLGQRGHNLFFMLQKY